MVSVEGKPRSDMRLKPIRICRGVSDYLFRLATESVRLYSNKMWALTSLNDTINSRSGRVETIVAEYGIEPIREHFRIIPTDGLREISIEIVETSAGSFETAAEMLSDALKQRMDVIDAVSISLYDFIVEEEISQVAKKLGLSGVAAAQYRDLIKHRGSNVVPIR